MLLLLNSKTQKDPVYKTDKKAHLSVASILCLFLTILPVILFAQVPDSSKTYIESYHSLVSLQSSINNDIESFKLRSPGFNLDLRPNTSLNNSYSFSYDFLIFSVSFSPDFINGNADNNLKGKTKTIRYSTNLGLGSHINQFLSFEKIRGYYLKNTRDFDSSWQNGQAYIQFPDLNYLSWHGITTFKVDPRFSQFASVTSYQRQERSAGSVLLNLSYNYYVIDDRTPLTGTNSSQRSNHFELLPSAGYSHTFVFKQGLYSSIGFDLGLGKVRTKLITRQTGGSVESVDWSTIYQTSGIVAFGYDNGRLFTGAEAEYIHNWRFQDANGSAIFNNQMIFQVFLGYRFDPPSFLKNTVGAVKNLLPRNS